MKQTDEDRLFSTRFADALGPHVSLERGKGKSLAEIASKLGVTAAGLQKQLSGGTPSIRTIAFAYAIYGVSVPYENIEIARAMSAKRKKKRKEAAEEQLFLPFEITAPPRSRSMSLKVVSRSVRRYQLQLTVGLSR
jgi:transcriptional regulator with XRE-family HTH domain